MPLIISIACGVIVTFQSTFNTQVSKIIGSFNTNLIVHMTGATLLIIIFLTRIPGGSFKGWNEVPIYYYTGGFMGALILASFMFTIPRLGLVTASGIVIAGQLITGLIFDYYGLFGLDRIPLGTPKIIGVGLLVTGAYLLLK
jgi:transporter family-2 protein